MNNPIKADINVPKIQIMALDGLNFLSGIIGASIILKTYISFEEVNIKVCI